MTKTSFPSNMKNAEVRATFLEDAKSARDCGAPLKVHELAAWWGKSPRHIRQMISDGRLKAHRHSGGLLIDWSEIDPTK